MINSMEKKVARNDGFLLDTIIVYLYIVYKMQGSH